MNIKKLTSSLLSMTTMIFGGFLLFNLGFLVFALIVNFSMLFMKQPESAAPSIISRLMGYLVIVGLSYLGLRLIRGDSQIKHTLRATIITLPLMAFLIGIGIYLYGQSDFFILAVSGVVILLVLLYLYLKKLPWMYWFAVLYVSLLGALVMIMDIDI